MLNIKLPMIEIYFYYPGPREGYLGALQTMLRKTVIKNKVNEKDFYIMDMQTPYTVVFLITLDPSGRK